jgi:pimeloyl-ACP methyl ester carboxylesterase
MSRMFKQFGLSALPFVLVFLLCSVGAVAQPQNVTTYTGTFTDGATYIIQVPDNWNGTLVLYSHGYAAPGGSNPAYDVGDSVTGNYLLASGYALGGSSYATTGWAIKEALPDQIAVLDTFNQIVGKPKRTIAWGHSLGGIITAGLVQRYPDRFDGALPMCGVIAGGVGMWNIVLDSEVAFATLLGSGSGLQVVNITNPVGNATLAETLLSDAQGTDRGKARIALTAALSDVPGWYDPSSPPPPPKDYAAQEANQYLWLANVDFIFAFDLRAELEGRAGGNFSWDTKVDFKEQLGHSVDYKEVKALYQKAGLNLDSDLKALNEATRVKVNPPSLDYLKKNIIFNGKIRIPVLTLHTEGDGLVVNENESAYKDAVDDAGNQNRLRQLFVHRAGHCAFTPGETIVAFQALVNRLDGGVWTGLGAGVLNNDANALGSGYNPYPPSYFKFEPAQFLRPYDAAKH